MPEVIGSFAVDIDGSGVAQVVFSRPPVNAVSLSVYEDIGKLAAFVEADDAIRVVVLTAPPGARAWCGGADLADFVGMDSERRKERYRFINEQVPRFYLLDRPVIAAINGPAAGAGLSLACACDIRVASDAAFFAPGFIGIGLVPDAGGTYFITRILGQARAFEWMSSGRRLSAEEALGYGLVTEAIPADAFEERVAEYAAALAAMPTKAIGWNKRLFDHATTATLDEQLELEAQLQAAAVQTGDFAEGVAAFLEKRAPSFKGA